MYKFNFNAIDGAFTKEFKTIAEFEKSWAPHGWDDSHYIVTDDGVNTIEPANDETLKAMEGYRLAKEHKFDKDVFIEELYSPLGITKEDLHALYLGTIHNKPGSDMFPKYLDIEAGRVYPINPATDKGKELEDIAFPMKSFLEGKNKSKELMFKKDTASFSDTYTRMTFVIDTSESAKKFPNAGLKEMIRNRPLERGISFNALDYRSRYEDIPCDIPEVDFFGSNDFIKETSKQYHEAFEGVPYYEDDCLLYRGFTNTADNPYDPKDLLNLHDIAEVSTVAEKETGKQVNRVIFDMETLVSVGSQTDEAHIYIDGEVHSIDCHQKKAEFIFENDKVKIIKELEPGEFSENYRPLTNEEEQDYYF